MAILYDQPHKVIDLFELVCINVCITIPMLSHVEWRSTTKILKIEGKSPKIL